MCVQGRWRKEPARADTSHTSCLQQLSVLLPARCAKQQEHCRKPYKQEGKKISKAVSSVRWGEMSVLCGCLLQSDGPPSSSRSEHLSQNSGIYNLSHRQHFYSTKACYIISTYKFTCFHKVKIHTYNPTTRSCIKTLLAPQQGIAQT